MSPDVPIPVDCLINVSPRKCLSSRWLQVQKPAVINVTKCVGRWKLRARSLRPRHTKEGSRGTGLVMWRKSAACACACV